VSGATLTKVMANEFGRYGITVNAIAPGSTATRRFEELVSITARERGGFRCAAEKHLLRERTSDPAGGRGGRGGVPRFEASRTGKWLRDQC